MCCFACRLLVRLCNEGRRVVRLKGGCCSVFSRVHSELSALRSAGCDVTMGATHPACPPLTLPRRPSRPALRDGEAPPGEAPGDQLIHMTGDTAARGGFTLLMALSRTRGVWPSPRTPPNAATDGRRGCVASRVSLAVPGISSSLSAPLFAGVPLTDKALSRHFAVTSCHDPDALDWAAFRGIDTLVLLMAAAKLPVVVDRLQQHSQRAQSTPVLVVRSAGTPEETVWEATLDSILQVTAGEKLSPCVVVVGAVADRSSWLSASEASDAPTFDL